MFGFDILQIASNAALNGLILVTSSTRGFTRISGLQVKGLECVICNLETEPKTHKRTEIRGV